MTLRDRIVLVDRAHAPFLRCEGRHRPDERCDATLPEWQRRQKERLAERGRVAEREITG